MTSLSLTSKVLTWSDPESHLKPPYSRFANDGPAWQPFVLRLVMVALTVGLAALGQDGSYHSPASDVLLPSLAGQSGPDRLIADDGRMGFVLLRLLEEDKQGFAQNQKSIGALREMLADVKADHPGTSLGLTGLPIIEYAEMHSSARSMTLFWPV